jgi:hypothetical protein
MDRPPPRGHEDERFLDRVVRLVAVSEHQLGDVEEPADRGGGKRREPLPIASRRLTSRRWSISG